jgi:ribonuclease HII
MPDFRIEAEHGGIVAGIDEAGRGPLAGPVIAAAVVLDGKALDILEGVDDSKALSRRQREHLYDRITAVAWVGLGAASVLEIDRLNVLQATFIAMARAVSNLGFTPDTALVDGNGLPDLPCTAHAIIAGDTSCLSIAAASVVAKVTRDRIMASLARAYPVYGWDHNAGYATAEHRAAIAAHGISRHHRRSFSPISQLSLLTL